MPLPTVAATLRWKTKSATRLKKAANNTAVVGLRTPVETTVAIELAASWKPFMKSNATANAISMSTSQSEACTFSIGDCRRQEFSRTMPSMTLATSSHLSVMVSSSS